MKTRKANNKALWNFIRHIAEQHIDGESDEQGPWEANWEESSAFLDRLIKRARKLLSKQ